jgi:magnesium transporter
MELAYNYLVEETKEIWEALDSYKSTIDALHEANDSLINYRTSDIMRTLTIFSVVIFVMTLVVGLFNLDLADNPLFNHEYGFRVILGIMALGVIGLLVFFKKKKWF